MPFDGWTLQPAFRVSGVERFWTIIGSEEPDEVRKEAQLRREWLIESYPKEMWTVPELTDSLMREAGMCYVAGAHYVCIMACQAAIESMLRVLAGNIHLDFTELVKKVNVLQQNEKTELCWLAAEVRNPIIHADRVKGPGERSNYEKAVEMNDYNMTRDDETKVLTKIRSSGTQSSRDAYKIMVAEMKKAGKEEPLKMYCKRALGDMIGMAHCFLNAPGLEYDPEIWD